MSFIPQVVINTGDSLELLKTLADNSIDSVVTDPPYELGFMDKDWDSTGIAYSVDLWKQCLRVLKPGGYLMAFSGARTYHRMVVAIEDAGFQIRDQIMWIYSSGFPKSHNVGLSIDKHLGHPNRGRAIPTASTFQASDEDKNNKLLSNPVDAYEAKSTEGQQYTGWGTALKPAHEPICMARKPLVGTVASNVLEYGTGAINVDDCRVGSDTIQINRWTDGAKPFGGSEGSKFTSSEVVGRFPANVIHDGSEEVTSLFPDIDGQLGAKRLVGGNFYSPKYKQKMQSGVKDVGSASRFFYCSKASKKERGEGNDHPTVKPIDLIRYLVRLVTPINGTVVDPFLGSGTTAIACVEESFNFVGYDLSEDYCRIALSRIDDTRCTIKSNVLTRQQFYDDCWDNLDY